MYYEITIELENREEARSAYDAIEALLKGMGNIGTLSMMVIVSDSRKD